MSERQVLHNGEYVITYHTYNEAKKWADLMNDCMSIFECEVEKIGAEKYFVAIYEVEPRRFRRYL